MIQLHRIALSGHCHPNVRAWLARIQALPRFVPMATSKVGLAA
jgi:hypothetical protein